MSDVPAAFKAITEELGRQYSLGYPKNQAGAGQTRDIKVRTRQSNLVVRARQSYCDGVALAACSLTFISAAS